MKKMNNKNAFFNKGPRNALILALILLGGLMIVNWMTDYARQIKPISYTTFLQQVEKENVRKVYVNAQDVYGWFKDGSRFETVFPENSQHWEQLKTHDVDVVVASPTGQISFWHLLLMGVLILLLVMAWQFMRQSRGSSGGGPGSSNIFSMGKSKAKMYMPSQIKENFESVAGAQEAKEDVKDLVDFLKNPEKYRRLGAQITRGVLMVGEPGNGKTLLAKAVAGEANCPFFSISGSDFIEVFVGVGASRVRDLFQQARKQAPCIIFIDEIDAVGRQRGSGLGGGHDEREQTLNQLLSEMDGFQTGDTPVIVMAATNRQDVLDKALLRPGRFDRQIEVPFPDLASREHILNLHAEKVKLEPDVDMQKIARGTPGFSGADLANLINEAAIAASKQNSSRITITDFEDARDKVLLGKERKSIVLTEDERRVTAFHESGHTLINLLLPDNTDPLHKVTIVPRSRALGVTHSLPDREKFTRTKQELLASIAVLLGGRVAEELVFDTVTTGASSDFRGATQIARSMVCDYGMSTGVGPVVYGQRQGEYIYSQKTAEAIDEEVRTIVEGAYQRAIQLVQDNRDKLDTLAQALLEKETLYAGEIYEMLGIKPREEHRFA